MFTCSLLQTPKEEYNPITRLQSSELRFSLTESAKLEAQRLFYARAHTTHGLYPKLQSVTDREVIFHIKWDTNMLNIDKTCPKNTANISTVNSRCIEFEETCYYSFRYIRVLLYMFVSQYKHITYMSTRLFA